MIEIESKYLTSKPAQSAVCTQSDTQAIMS